jgi:hypothetical protein
MVRHRSAKKKQIRPAARPAGFHWFRQHDFGTNDRCELIVHDTRRVPPRRLVVRATGVICRVSPGSNTRLRTCCFFAPNGLRRRQIDVLPQMLIRAAFDSQNVASSRRCRRCLALQLP